MKFKTDDLLEQFQIFKSIRLLLDTYLEENTDVDRIPSIQELYARNMYDEWMELAQFMAESDDWTKEDWENFVVCMSMAEATKSTLTSICYALAGLRASLAEVPEYNLVNNELTIVIKVLKNVTNISRIKELLQRAIEYLIIVKNANITIIIELLELDVTTEVTSSFAAEVNIGVFGDTTSTYLDLDTSDITITSDTGSYVIYADTTSDYDGTYDGYHFSITPEELTSYDSSYYKLNVDYTYPSDLPETDMPYVTFDTSTGYLYVLRGVSSLPSGTTIIVSLTLNCIFLTNDEINNTKKEVTVVWV